MRKKTVEDIDVSGKRVLVRVDFNVPLTGDGKIADDTRIRACLPTMTYLIRHRARVILCSHLGRPHGKVDERLRLAPVARRLSELLKQPVIAPGETTGPEVTGLVFAMRDGDVVLLENLRFCPGEEKNDTAFARELAGLGELFVNDAFGASHRAHASVVGVAALLPAVAGLLMEKEIEQLSRLLEDPARPFAAILGGAKVDEKLDLLAYILPKTDLVLVGGGMAGIFLSAAVCEPGGCTIPGLRERAGLILKRAQALGIRILLPDDVVAAERPEAGAPVRVVPPDGIPQGWIIADIGPQTIAKFAEGLRGCRTVVWNGPVGVFEVPAFAKGTAAIAETLASLGAVTVIGGGSTAEAVTELGLAGRMTHVSTGGGATLRFLSGKSLPGIDVLPGRS